MDLSRMLENCRRDQWSVRDLDWTQRPRAMTEDDERAIVQLFTDMAGIERLAAALFHEQEQRATNPTLKAIFRTFVGDEVRHAQTAQMLADHYDVHRFEIYRINRSLQRFTPHFLNAIRLLSDDVANAYVTGGELILDVALLRSINDYVDDGMSAQAMRLINRDESRHIAIDYYMVEYYASDAYTKELEARASRAQHRPTAGERARAAWTFTCLLYSAKPFVRDMFVRPMDRIDPSGQRLREAFKRYQLLGNKPVVALRPFGKFMRALQDTFNHPLAGPVLGRVIARVAGAPPQFMKRLYTEDELAEAAAMSYEALAEDAIRSKSSASVHATVDA